MHACRSTLEDPTLSFVRGEGTAQVVPLTDFGADGPASLSLAPDGRTLLLAGNGVVQVWDLPRRRQVARFSPPEGTGLDALALSAEQGIAALVGGNVVLLDARGAAVRTLLAKPPAAPRQGRRDDGGGYSYFPGVQALAFAPAGDLLASFGHPDGGLRLVDVASGRTRHVLVEPGREPTHYELRNVAFAHDGRMLAAETEAGLVEVWETSTGRRRRGFLGHRSYQTTLAFSPDGSRLATGNRDATVLVWDVFGGATVSPPDAPFTAADLEALWVRLLDGDAERACLAMGRLLRQPAVSGPFLGRLLLGRTDPDTDRLRAWIADLDADDFDRRETASAELAKRLAAAEPLLKATLANHPPPEARRRLITLLASAEARALPPETVRDLRALEILEHLGPTTLTDVARRLGEGRYDPWVSAAATAVRMRLASRTP